MNLREQISGHRYLFLSQLSEAEPNEIVIAVEEGRAMGPPEDIDLLGVTVKDTRAVDTDETCFAYEVTFGTYIAYSVRNESFTTEDPSETFTGGLFRVYTASRFLDFVRDSTFATGDFPGAFKHYEIICEWQIIDVASIDEPSIRITRHGV